MLISPIENFILFSTIFAVVCFGVSFVTKVVAARGLWNLSPQTLIRLYIRALVIPPVLAAHGVVILGGIFTSTFLNMIVIPALYLKFGRAEAQVTSHAYPSDGELATAGD